MAQGFLSRAFGAVAESASSNLGDMIEEERKKRLAKYELGLNKDLNTHNSGLRQGENAQQHGFRESEIRLGTTEGIRGRQAEIDMTKNQFSDVITTDANGNSAVTAQRNNFDNKLTPVDTYEAQASARKDEQVFREDMLDKQLSVDVVKSEVARWQNATQFDADLTSKKGLEMWKILAEQQTDLSERIQMAQGRDEELYNELVKKDDILQANQTTLMKEIMGTNARTIFQKDVTDYSKSLGLGKDSPAAPGAETPLGSTVPPQIEMPTEVEASAAPSSGGLMSQASQQAEQMFDQADIKKVEHLKKLIAQTKERLADPDTLKKRDLQKVYDRSVTEYVDIYQRNGLTISKDFFNQ